MRSLSYDPARAAESGSAQAMGCKPNEIEPGRAVPNVWDRHLTESWTERKARLAAQRQTGAHP